DMTFARALRAILRQDPDVIMIGEIRDQETAQIAVQASLTGHLVLATLHTNDSISAVTRLLDMGIEPFLLSSSILGILAQRLVRKLCPDCRGTGCPKCLQTGYLGRTGIYELLEIDEPMRAAIHARGSEQRLAETGAQRIVFQRRRFSEAELALATRQLASLLSAGLPIAPALGGAIEQAEDRAVREVFAAVRSDVFAGHRLAEALAQFPREFP